jgi:phospholipase C
MTPAGDMRDVVIIVKESHALDKYLENFKGANAIILLHSSNPYPLDSDHRHTAWLTRKTTAVKAQFVELDIPANFAYAHEFTLCDNYVTDVAGP